MADLGSLLQPVPAPQGPAPDFTRLLEALLLSQQPTAKLSAQSSPYEKGNPLLRGSVSAPLGPGEVFASGSYEKRPQLSPFSALFGYSQRF